MGSQNGQEAPTILLGSTCCFLQSHRRRSHPTTGETGGIPQIKMLGQIHCFAPMFLFFTLYMSKVTRNLHHISDTGGLRPQTTYRGGSVAYW